MYPIGAPLTGYLMDRVGLRAGFVICGAGWSLICMAHAFAGGWVGLFVLRGMLGLVESSFIPGGMRVAAFWFPAQERGIAAGVFNLGASFGAILIAWSILHYDWHAAFLIVGGLALAWATLWLALYRNPNRHLALSSGYQKNDLWPSDRISPSMK